MICLSVGKPSIETLRALAEEETSRLVEIRLDGIDTPLTSEAVKQLFELPLTSIATCRVTKNRNEEQRKNVLLDAIKAGANYVDVEIEADDKFKQDIMIEAHRHQCKMIISYHNFQDTPGRSQLKRIVEDCFAQGADIAKVACRVHSEADSANLLSLYSQRFAKEPDTHRRGSAILALGMGEKGKVTRIAAPLLGSPFTFASAGGGEETAPGQLDEKSLKEIYRLIGVQ